MIKATEIAEIIKQLCTAEKYWIAFSGGLDSHVLLHLVAQSFPLEQITAVHINHGLSPNADQWQAHCHSACAQLNINFQALSVKAHPFPGQSPEAAARDARYDALLTLIEKNAVLLTAHQQDDQAETVLLQMLRGGGVAGLAAMPAIKTFGKGYLVRPLLNFTRAELQHYAQVNQLQWIEDESNNDSRFDRNFLRLELFPILKKRWPHTNQLLSKFAQQCAEDENSLNALADVDINNVSGVSQNNLYIPELLKLNQVRQRNVLRYWFKNLQGIFPSRNIIHAIQNTILQAKHDAQPLVEYEGIIIRRFDNYLCASFDNVQQADLPIVTWHHLNQPLLLPAKLGRLIATWQEKPTQPIMRLSENVSLKIGFRVGGEKIHPLGRMGHHHLKKLFQEWHIPPWERNHIPLIYYEDKLIAIPGYTIAQEYATQEGESGYMIEWQKE